MRRNLVDNNACIESFIGLMHRGPKTLKASGISNASSGKRAIADIPAEIQLKISDLINPSITKLSNERALFDGNLSQHCNDASRADLALISYFKRRGLLPLEADIAFRASGLYRPKWDEMRGESTYGQRTITTAYREQSQSSPTSRYDQLQLIRPSFVAGGMPPRDFVGPLLTNGVRLFPLGAISALVALGATGKTTLLMSLAAHIAAGKSWGESPLKAAKVMLLCVEETEAELTRKFSATVEDWTTVERDAAMLNLSFISFVGKDPRLTTPQTGSLQGSGLAEDIVRLANQASLQDGLVILDHMQGFASGDLNISETAVAICREANKIVDATGAAVVFAAHISKANIAATTVEQGFAVGSLAFENAVRQMSGMIGMTPDQAKNLGLTDFRKEFAMLSVAKNSYGPSGGDIWIRKEYKPEYHTVIAKPTQLKKPIPITRKTSDQRLADSLVAYISEHPNTTKNKLDLLAGLKEHFKASKPNIRRVIDELIQNKVLELYEVSATERNAAGLSKQIKGVLRISSQHLMPTIN